MLIVNGRDQPFPCQGVKRIADFDGIIQHDTISDKTRIFDTFLLFDVRSFIDGSGSGKGNPVLEGVVLFHFIRATVNHLTQFLIRNKGEEKAGTHNGPQSMKRLIETIFAAVGGQLPQEHRWQHLALLDRNDNAQEILPMGGDEIPIDHIVPKERVDMVIVGVFG